MNNTATMTTYNPVTPRTPAPKLLPPFESPSPTSDYYSELTASTARFPDPITLLSQRWQHIARQIASCRLERDTVVALNRNLDEAENILLWSAPAVVQQANKTLGLGIMRDSNREERMDGLAEMTPPASAEPDAPGVVEFASRKRLEDEANAALMGRLSKAVEQLRQRHEEFKVRGSAVQWLRCQSHR